MPVNYNNSYDGGFSTLINVEPQELYEHSKTLNALVAMVMDEVRAIDQLWEGLQLQWQGADATAAQEFAARLSAAFTAMFGPESAKTIADLGPGQGALMKLGVGVSMAAHNYGSADFEVRNMIAKFADDLENSHPAEGPDTVKAGPVTLTNHPK